MDEQERTAREAVIVQLLEIYPSSSVHVTDSVIRGYVDASSEYSFEALARACGRFAKGEVPDHNNSFPPSGAELAAQARLFDDILRHIASKSNPVTLHSGILSVDCGHGRIDMRGLTVDEQDHVLRLGGRAPDGRNLAGMSPQAIVEALKGEPVAEIAGTSPAIPRLKTMREASR